MTVIKSKLIKKIGSIVIFICILSIQNIISAKYIFNNEFCVANVNIDRTKPIIEVLEITNTNVGYERYANKTHTITVKLKVIEKHIKNLYFDYEHIKARIGNIYIDNKCIEIQKTQDIQDGVIYQLKLNQLEGNGRLRIEIAEGSVIDESDLINDKSQIYSSIWIDNICPEGVFSEEKIDDGKVNGIITVKENIRNLEGWQFLDNEFKLQKEFTNNISYELPIIDYAGNISYVDINITQATYINLVYASHNSQVGWTFGYGNYDVAGKGAIEQNPIYKTEALAFNISGNLDADFVQANSYIYTYWGENSYGRCLTSNLKYNYGYNPEGNLYKSMYSDDLVAIGDKNYFQFGGSGINSNLNTDFYGNNPIPTHIAAQYKYGICGINMRLKDYSEYSIVYQILVDKVGWIYSCADGGECIFDKFSPMSAFRIALVPKSEKQFVIDTWDKDVGTFNM